MTYLLVAIVFIIALLFVLGLHTFDKVDIEVEIEGSADDVWNVLSDFKNYSDWNPFITEVTGELKKGETVKTTITLPFSKTMDFDLYIDDLKTGESFSWTSKIAEPKILDSVHYFKIEKNDNGNVNFSQGEKFSGLLLYIVFPIIRSSLEKNFGKMNSALKNKVEGVVDVAASELRPQA